MKIVKKNVYYCDCCKKRSLSSAAMKKHEKHCTLNPKRTCRLCECAVILEPLISEYKSRFVIEDLVTIPDPVYMPEWTETNQKAKWIGEPITLQEIREQADNCPVCMLAILRQTGLNRHFFEGMIDEFDYKEESEEYLRHKNYTPERHYDY